MNENRVDVVSISGGKDSQAAATVCLDQRGAGDVRLLFCDTGNEHPLTLEHIEYLSGFWGVEVVTLRATFDGHMARKREYILSVWPTEGIPLAVCELAASLLVPTGNPYLDLCLWKSCTHSSQSRAPIYRMMRSHERFSSGQCLQLHPHS